MIVRKDINNLDFNYLIMFVILITIFLRRICQGESSSVHIGLESGLVVWREAAVDKAVDKLSLTDEGRAQDT